MPDLATPRAALASPTPCRIRPVDPASPAAEALMLQLDQRLSAISGDSGRSSFDADSARGERALFVIAEDPQSGAGLGCAALRPLPQGGVAELKRMFAVDGSRGVGSALLRHLEQQALDLGYREVWLETRRLNERALAFYRRHGYAEIPGYGRYAERADSICLGKLLAPELQLSEALQIDAVLEGELSELLIDSVHHGASVGFVRPLPKTEARVYWQGVSRSLSANHRLLVLRDQQRLLGSVQLDICGKPNGRHRAEVQKLFVHTSARGRGLASLLLKEAEALARLAGCSLLVLDTESGSKAEQVYRHHGWQHAGNIPDFAASPDGRLHATALYYKQLPPLSAGA